MLPNRTGMMLFFFWPCPSIVVGIMVSFVCSWTVAAEGTGQIQSERILAFAECWAMPQDYAWKRETSSQLKTDDKPGLVIEDMGRFRVEFVKFEDESAILNIRVLQYQFESRLKGDPPMHGKSPLEGVRLPPVWFHWALGSSIGLIPGKDKPKPVTDQQAAQIIDLIDFRGFIPDQIPHKDEEWPLKISPDRGKTFLFKEELERNFHCEECEKEGDKTTCRIRFSELFKLTPTAAAGNWELTERKGTYWLSHPKFTIDAAEWKTETTESMKVPGGATQIITRADVSLTRIDVPFNYKKTPGKGKIRKAEVPLPPR